MPGSFKENESPPIVGRSPISAFEGRAGLAKPLRSRRLRRSDAGASIFDHADTHPDVKCGEECSLVRLHASACGNARRVVDLIPMLLQLRGALWRACYVLL